MRVYATDQEQLEALKLWWKQNGIATVSIIILAIIISFCWHYWQQYKLQKAQVASMIYEQMVTAFAQQRTDVTGNYADVLTTKYEGTTYSDAALLLEAKMAVDNNQLDVALTKLQEEIKHGNNNTLKQVAKIRAARILLAQKQYMPALAQLNEINDKAYLPAVAIVRGDIYLAMGDKDKARNDYKRALGVLSKTDPMRALVQMKLDQIAAIDQQS